MGCEQEFAIFKKDGAVVQEFAGAGSMSGYNAAEHSDTPDLFNKCGAGTLLVYQKRAAFQQILGWVAAYCHLRENNEIATLVFCFFGLFGYLGNVGRKGADHRV